MFGAQGQQSSRDCAFQVGTVCRTPIRMSYFVAIFFFYQLADVAKQSGRSTSDILLWRVLQALGNEFILLLTVLCHEFGHGNMARYLGGQIDHILLWVFGGICFSTRPEGHFDNAKLLRDDLLIVAAGPTTHFIQAPAWGLLLWLAALAIESSRAGLTGYAGFWQAFQAALNPLSGGVDYSVVWGTVGKWSALLWSLIGQAISLNVALFIFNVFFPMYPADGAKLLVTGLMFFCGVPPRSAALVLVCASVPCALLMIGYSVYGVVRGGNMLGGVMGWMGVMSLMEAYNIWQLRKARRLHEHALFKTARSWRRREHDGFGYVHRINVTDFDDEAPLTRGGCRELWASMCQPRSGGGGWGCAGCLGCLFPCLLRRSGAREGSITAYPLAASPLPSPVPLQAADVRNQRQQFLSEMDRQRAERQRTVRQYMDDRYGGGAPASPLDADAGAAAGRGQACSPAAGIQLSAGDSGGASSA